MMYYTHVPGGVAAALLYQTCYPSATLGGVAIAGVCGGIGGLLPDIDTPTSKISQLLPPVSFLIRLFCDHRGPTHTLLFWSLLLGIPGVLFPTYAPYLLSTYIGALSHLLLDACTPKGAPMLAPFYKKKLRLLRIQTGGMLEHGVSGALCLACVYLAYLLVQ